MCSLQDIHHTLREKVNTFNESKQFTSFNLQLNFISHFSILCKLKDLPQFFITFFFTQHDNSVAVYNNQLKLKMFMSCYNVIISIHVIAVWKYIDDKIFESIWSLISKNTNLYQAH